MAKQTIDKLKSWFKTALKPTQQQFWDWMDSYWHKDEKIAIGNVDGLTDIVNNTASATVLNTVSERLNEHLNDTGNPHNVTKEQIGLDLVDNTSDVDKPLSNAAIAEFNSINDAITNTLNTHVEDTNNPHHVTAAQVGLDKVNNTSDADKPISTATQTALNGKLSQGGDAFGAPVVVGSKDNKLVQIISNNIAGVKVQPDGSVQVGNTLYYPNDLVAQFGGSYTSAIGIINSKSAGWYGAYLQHYFSGTATDNRLLAHSWGWTFSNITSPALSIINNIAFLGLFVKANETKPLLAGGDETSGKTFSIWKDGTFDILKLRGAITNTYSGSPITISGSDAPIVQDAMGTNVIIQSGQSYGNGSSGWTSDRTKFSSSIIFQTSTPATASSSTANSYATRMKIDGITGNVAIDNLKGVGSRMLLADSNGNITNLSAVVSGEKFVTQTASGIQNNYDCVEQEVVAGSLSTANWSSGTVTYTGFKGQYAIDANYRYDCIDVNTWTRTLRIVNWQEAYLTGVTIDDSGGDKTADWLNTNYSSVPAGQRIKGVVNVYERVDELYWIILKKAQ